MAFRIMSYLRESRTEMRKVIWPSRKETTRHTLLVIGLSLGVAAFLGAIDYLLNQLLQQAIAR